MSPATAISKVAGAGVAVGVAAGAGVLVAVGSGVLVAVGAGGVAVRVAVGVRGAFRAASAIPVLSPVGDAKLPKCTRKTIEPNAMKTLDTGPAPESCA